MAAYTVCPPHKKELEALLDESVYMDEVREQTDLHAGLSGEI